MWEHLAWEGCQSRAMTQDPIPQQGQSPQPLQDFPYRHHRHRGWAGCPPGLKHCTSQQRTFPCNAFTLWADVFLVVCPPQALLRFGKISAITVLFSVAKIWDTYAVLSILASGLLGKLSAARAWRFGIGCPPWVGSLLLSPNWLSYSCPKTFW